MLITIHLGAHKTGSTLIQNFGKRNKLLEKFKTKAFVGKFIRETVNSAPNYKNRRQEVLELVNSLYEKNFNSVLLSSEELLGKALVDEENILYPHAEKNLSDLRQWLPDNYKIQLILYIREYSSFFQSYYIQQVQTGLNLSFEDWIKIQNIDNLSWVKVINIIKKYFPNSNLLVLDYEDEISPGSCSFLQSFYTLVNPKLSSLSSSAFRFDGFENRSLSDIGVKLAITTNQIEIDTNSRNKIRAFLQENFSNIHYPSANFFETDKKSYLIKKYAADKAIIGV